MSLGAENGKKTRVRYRNDELKRIAELIETGHKCERIIELMDEFSEDRHRLYKEQTIQKKIDIFKTKEAANRRDEEKLMAAEDAAVHKSKIQTIVAEMKIRIQTVRESLYSIVDMDIFQPQDEEYRDCWSRLEVIDGECVTMEGGICIGLLQEFFEMKLYISRMSPNNEESDRWFRSILMGEGDPHERVFEVSATQEDSLPNNVTNARKRRERFATLYHNLVEKRLWIHCIIVHAACKRKLKNMLKY